MSGNATPIPLFDWVVRPLETGIGEGAGGGVIVALVAVDLDNGTVNEDATDIVVTFLTGLRVVGPYRYIQSDNPTKFANEAIAKV